MKTRGKKHTRIALGLAGLAFILGMAWTGTPQKTGGPALLGLVPEIEGWKLSEKPQSFFPDNLYEYIDGAAESYIGYDFKELIVAQFQKAGTTASVTLEIYDMGNGTNAFGIFSAERFPENKVVDVGTLGYIEGEVLNFIVGKDYVKILSFDGGAGTPAVLDAFARKVSEKTGEKGTLPPLLSVFPREGIIANSEKYILRNVMGFEFLRNGYMASYKLEGTEFECFLIKADEGRDPAVLLKQLLEFYTEDRQPAEDISLGHHVRNKYGQNLYIGVSGTFLCGVNRLPDGAGKIGNRYLKSLAESLLNPPGSPYRP
ncbi:hypothetical protein D4R89_12700 [bacterium]|nr:MAG: hypothetical protein D4R89_12700 [bacterium]